MAPKDAGWSLLYFDGNLHLVSEGECYAPRVADRRMVDRCIPERGREFRNSLFALEQGIQKEVNGMPLCFPSGAFSLDGGNPRGGVLVPLGQTILIRWFRSYEAFAGHYA